MQPRWFHGWKTHLIVPIFEPICFIYCCCLDAVVSNSLQPYGLQHARLPCPSLSPRVCSNSCLLCWWCHRTVSSSVSPFSSCPQSIPASGFLPVSGSSHQVAKVLELQFSLSPFSEYSGYFPQIKTTTNSWFQRESWKKERGIVTCVIS